MRYTLTTAFALGLILLPSVPQDAAKGENSAPSAAYSKKFAAKTVSSPDTDADASASTSVNAPPKPAVFDIQTLPLKTEISQAEISQKVSQEKTQPIQRSTIQQSTVQQNDEEYAAVPVTKKQSAQRVQVHEHKQDDFWGTLTTTANRSKRWVSDNTRKAANYFNKDKDSAKSAPEQNAYIQGLAAEQRQDVSAAVRLYKAYIRENKIERGKNESVNADIAAPYYRLAMISWNEQDFSGAENYFREATTYAVGNNKSVVARDFSRFLLERKKIKDAEVVLRNILIDEPNNKEFLLPLARCIAMQERPIESLRYFTAVFDDDKEKAYAELAAVYRSQNRHDMAQVAERKRQEYIAVNTPNVPAAPVMPSTSLIAQSVPVPLIPRAVSPVPPKDAGDTDAIGNIAARLEELSADKESFASKNTNAEAVQKNEAVQKEVVRKNAEAPRAIPPQVPKPATAAPVLRFVPVVAVAETKPAESSAVVWSEAPPVLPKPIAEFKPPVVSESAKPVVRFIPPEVKPAEVVKDRSRYISFTEKAPNTDGVKVLPKVQTDKIAQERSATIVADYSALWDYSIRMR